jgi:hypothetical protein
MSDERPIPLSRLRAALASPRGHKRVDALLSQDDAAAAVGALDIGELYALIREVGFADSQELIALCTPTQVRGCLDLDLWDRDQVQLEAAKPWLAAVFEAGFEQLGQVWEGLDPELRALMLARWTRIYDLSLGEEPDEPDEVPLYFTPDTFFAVAITAEDDDTVGLVQRLLDDLYRADMVLARHTLMAARSEPPPELEDMAYRWRSGRLADLGFADYYDALEVFRPIDPGSVRIGEGSEDRFGAAPEGEEVQAPGRLPAPVAERIAGRSFLARAVDGIQEAEHAERVEQAFVVLLNKVLAAARVRPGDPEAVAIGADHTTGTVALGLEHLARGDVEAAADALRTVSLTRIHRLGYTLTLRLARLARALAPRSPGAGEPTAALMEALLAPRPFFARALDDPPGDGLRPFESLEDLRRAAGHLTALALRVAIAESLGVDLVAGAMAGSQPALDDFVRTALARAMAGGAFEAAPLTDAELAALGPAFADGRLTGPARRAAAEALAGALTRASITAGTEQIPALLEGWLATIEDSLGPHAGRPVDPRFIEGLLLAAGRS